MSTPLAAQPKPPASPLPDQSFTVYETSDPGMLAALEGVVAAYANGLMTSLKEYKPRPDDGSGASAGFFPHGTVDSTAAKFSARAGLRPLQPEEISPAYPSPILPKGGLITVVETSEELTLTKSGDTTSSMTKMFPVPPGTHLVVYGNVVTIKGKISAPGKHVLIFARELHTLSTGNSGAEEDAEIDVSAVATPKDIIEFQTSAAEGATGPPAQQFRSFRFLLASLDENWREYRGDVDNVYGGQGFPGNPGQEGRAGEPGFPGGEIVIVCDRVAPYSRLKLNTSGGRGGRGQRGQNGGKGGDGGEGKDAGDKYPNDRTIFTTHYDDYKYFDPLDGGEGAVGGSGGIGGAGGVGGNCGNCTLIVNQSVSADSTIQSLSKLGAAGARGDGGDVGKKGIHGRNGILPSELKEFFPPYKRSWELAVPSYSSNIRYPDPQTGDQRLAALTAAGKVPAELQTPSAKWGRYLLIQNVNVLSSGDKDQHALTGLRGIAQASHLQKVLETARLRYLQWDAYRFAQGSTTDSTLPVKTEQAKKELLSMLDFLPFGLRLMSRGENKLRDGIDTTVTVLKTNVEKGLDYFGHAANFVKIGPPKYHLGNFNTTLERLRVREIQYRKYVKELADFKAVNEERKAAISHADELIRGFRSLYESLRTELFDLIEDRIPSADNAVYTTRRNLRPALETLQHWVKTCFGLTADDFLDCVFNLAFIGSPINANSSGEVAGKTSFAGHGAFTALTTITSQAGKLINKAVNTLPNDEGQPVSRKHVLKRIDSISKKLDMSEAYSTIKSARAGGAETAKLDDPDAYRLLVSQQDFEELLDQFSTHPEAQAVKAAMDEYVNSVQERNELLATYNAKVAEYLGVLGEIEATEGHKETIEQLWARNAEPNRGPETAFAAALYNRTRESCIEYCYLASRSYRFWSLQPETSLYNTIRLGAPNEMNYMLLSGVAEELFNQRSAEITNVQLPHPPTYFPSRDAKPDVPGFYFALKPSVYSLQLVSCARKEDLPDQASRSVVVGVVGNDNALHVRVFNAARKRTVDKAEHELAAGEALVALKKKVVPTILERSILKAETNQRFTLVAASMTDHRLQSETTACRVCLALVDAKDDLPTNGRNLVIVAVVNRKPIVRVFDSDGRMFEPDYIINEQDTELWPELLPTTGDVSAYLNESMRPILDELLKMHLGDGYGPPADARLSVMQVQSEDDLPKSGSNRVIVASGLSMLYFCIFDSTGNKWEKAENTFLSGPRAEDARALILRLKNVVFTTMRRRAHILRFAEELTGCRFGYDISLQSVATRDEITSTGSNSVALTLIGDSTVQIRIFDESGKRVAGLDLTERNANREIKEIFDTLRTARQRTFASRFKWLTETCAQEIIDAVAVVAGHPLPTAYPKEFQELKSTGVATFRIPLPNRNSNLESNPFANFSNVRLSRVRAWVRGIKTSGSCGVLLRQKGQELICSREGNVVPFAHDPVETTFIYNWENVEWSKTTEQVRNPSDVVMADSALAVNVDGDDYLQMIGPFSEWEISLTSELNADLDMSEIEAIYLEFHGFAQTRAK